MCDFDRLGLVQVCSEAWIFERKLEGTYVVVVLSTNRFFNMFIKRCITNKTNKYFEKAHSRFHQYMVKFSEFLGRLNPVISKTKSKIIKK